ncbi:hypothetical protein RYX36_015536 [Vicia faba]
MKQTSPAMGNRCTKRSKLQMNATNNKGSKRNATEIKPTKSKFTKNLGKRLAPPKFNIKKEGRNGLMNENLYNMLNKNMFFLPQEEDDNDFIPNFHPSSNIGYEASDTGFVILEVVIPTRMKLALYLVQSSNNVLFNEVVSKATKYWDIQENRRKALVKI